jgi:two-component system, OmpR family, KDP operon response regulator KdpE
MTPSAIFPQTDIFPQADVCPCLQNGQSALNWFTVSIYLPQTTGEQQMNPNTVLLIDGQAKTRRLLRAGFELGGYSVGEAETAVEGLRIATFSPPDLVVLEVILPDLSGAEVLERIRSWSNVPIIIASVVSSEHEKVRFLQAGADDYVVKPFGMAEVLARSEALLRRSFKSRYEDHIVSAGPLAVNLATRIVEFDRKPLKLTRQEHRLLCVLATHAGFIITHDQLLHEIWPKTGGDIQYLRVLVRKLRQKIESDPEHPRLLITESGIGYRLENGPEAAAAE